MADSLFKLFQITSVIQDLNMVQSWIDQARISYPEDREVQQELDRKQEDVNNKKLLIEKIMIDIRSRN